MTSSSTSIKINDRIWNASACWSSTKEQVDKLVASGIGTIVGKTCTLCPRSGNTGEVYGVIRSGVIRSGVIRSGVICNDITWNRMRLPNLGYEYYRDIAIYTMKTLKTPYILSIYIQNDDETLSECLQILCDYQRVLEEESIPEVIVELNLSCPNHTDRIPGYHAKDIREIMHFLHIHHLEFSRIIFGLKLPPYFEKFKMSKLTMIFEWYAELIAYIVCSNTIPNGMHPVHGLYGGLSGSPINRMIAIGNIVFFRDIFKANNVPIRLVGCGGIRTAEDIQEYFDVGARAVQLGSGLYNRESNSLDVERIHEIIDSMADE